MTSIIVPTHLRVKNWGSFQHYRDRCPPWIKLHNSLLTDNRFLEMTEVSQWKLVRIWMLASRSDDRAFDNLGHVVPAIGSDEHWIRRSIGSLARVPVEVFVADGWLIPVDLLDASTDASTHASADASAHASETGPYIEVTEGPENKRFREVQNQGLYP